MNPALNIECPKCKALAGVYCLLLGEGDAITNHVHNDRMMAAVIAVTLLDDGATAKLQDRLRLAEQIRDAAQAASNRSLEEKRVLEAELAGLRAVADPDNETPELSLRDRIMHVGEQAALLVSVNRMCERRGAERDEARQGHGQALIKIQQLEEQVQSLAPKITTIADLNAYDASQPGSFLVGRELRTEVKAWRYFALNVFETLSPGDTAQKARHLIQRRDELLALVAKLSQTVPLDSEVAEALEQRGALLAEVGTLRAKIAEVQLQPHPLPSISEAYLDEAIQIVDLHAGEYGPLENANVILRLLKRIRAADSPKVTRRADGAYTVGPPPDGRSVDEHLTELAAPHMEVDDRGTLWIKKPKTIRDEQLYIEGWKKGVTESIDKLFAYRASAIETTVGAQYFDKAIELLNNRLANPPEPAK